jgi:hypothetical protein
MGDRSTVVWQNTDHPQDFRAHSLNHWRRGWHSAGTANKGEKRNEGSEPCCNAVSLQP